MSHSDSQFVQSNRPVSRRLHRRLAHCVMSSCFSSTNVNVHERAPSTVLGLPKSLVQEAGMFELLSAELRIAELEAALAEAREVACVDPLTGALNRRGFDEACQRELARARRSGVRFALVHIDLDDFKNLNDTLGHHAGDRALVHLVNMLQQSKRPSDVLCRFGGEEFLLMLPDTTLEDAHAATSRFLREFSAQAIPGTNSVMTFSAGVVVQSLDESIEQAIERADGATYTAKRSGKNCVVTC